MLATCCVAQFPSKAGGGSIGLNFFLADVQTGFGAFVAFYLAELGWQKGQVGLALAAGTVAALVAQIPGGALVDAAPWKRGLAAIGVCMTGASALILAVAPAHLLVFVAQILNGVSGGIVTPAIAAISPGARLLRGRQRPYSRRNGIGGPRCSTAQAGLAWPGLAWPGLAWPGLAWPISPHGAIRSAADCYSGDLALGRLSF